MGDDDAAELARWTLQVSQTTMRIAARVAARSTSSVHHTSHSHTHTLAPSQTASLGVRTARKRAEAVENPDSDEDFDRAARARAGAGTGAALSGIGGSHPAPCARSPRQATFWAVFEDAHFKLASAIYGGHVVPRVLDTLPSCVRPIPLSSTTGAGEAETATQCAQTESYACFRRTLSCRGACAALACSPSALSVLVATDRASARVGRHIRAASERLALQKALTFDALVADTALFASALLADADADARVTTPPALPVQAHGDAAAIARQCDEPHARSLAGPLAGPRAGPQRAAFDSESESDSDSGRVAAKQNAAADGCLVEAATLDAALDMYAAACGGARFPCLRSLACFMAHRALWQHVRGVPKELGLGLHKTFSQGDVPSDPTTASGRKKEDLASRLRANHFLFLAEYRAAVRLASGGGETSPLDAGLVVPYASVYPCHF